MVAGSDWRAHWQTAYERRDPAQLSWYEPMPERSLELIEAAGTDRDAAIIDAGGGASGLAGELLRRGYGDVTVCDIAPGAMAAARRALGGRAVDVSWIEADVRDHDFGRTFDLWHDRAVLHFMVEPEDRAAYVSTLLRSLRPGGHAIVATFGPDGPERCSGLPVRRYDGAALLAELGTRFEPVASRLVDHRTPSGGTQQFHYSLLRRCEHETVDDVLAEARSGLRRLEPAEARDAVRAGAVLVDIRSDRQRERDGEIPGAVAIPRNVLEWRCDPASEHRDGSLARRDRRVILICDEGYQSSLAAATLRRFGLDATDVIGGYQAWRAASRSDRGFGS